ncbi:uncharacterized protein LOC126878685 [Diabrotica virgifera virgifera]|uniref:Uncharacterized protein n=1 Tax=Diabrotica virgifera virgifera TaxID=50390 RepID=A0ABM5JHT7_DIAVI|nr:uncharacterized protein LOC126878685 [Diabrotica virgifera virgifera]
MILEIGNMDAMEEVKKELNKLNKSDLIRIIIGKKVPTDLKTSIKVIQYVESEKIGSLDATDEILDNFIADNAEPVSEITLKYELKIANIQVEASTRLIKELERTISNKDLIINLLQNPANLEVKHESNTNTGSSVAVPSPEYVATGNGRKINSKPEIRQNRQVTHHQVSSALMQVQQNIKMNDIQTLGQNVSQTRSDGKIVGNNSDNVDIASKDKVWVYATKYKTSYTTEKMENYLQSKFPGHEFSCTLYKNKIKGSNSFRISADAELRDTLFKPHTWPSGIEVSEYFFRRKRTFQKSPKDSGSTTRR